MPTVFWVVYDVILGLAGFWTFGRALTREERFGLAILAVMGLGVAVYSGYSDYSGSKQIEALTEKVNSLTSGQAYNTGQLSTIGRMSGKTFELLASKSDVSPNTADAVGRAAVAKIDALSSRVNELETYKNEHEAEEWPALTDPQQTEWGIALSPFAGKIQETVVVTFDSRAERLAESIGPAFQRAKLPLPMLMNGGVTEGIAVRSNVPAAADIVRKLIKSDLGYDVPPIETNVGTQKPYLEVDVGRRPASLPPHK